MNSKTVKQANKHYLNLQQLLENQNRKHIVQIPLDFNSQPIQILTKQLTKLNNNYSYRIIYLGPRFQSNISLHKRYSKSQQAQYKKQFYNYPNLIIQKYKMDNKRYVRSSNIQKYLIKSDINQGIYYRAFQGMNPTLQKFNDDFQFNSNFQSGNLDCAIKINQKQYDLFLRVDSNTKNYTMWYYFSIKNKKAKGKVLFNICNISKSKNLYQNNMKPYVLSQKKLQKFSINWRQDGSDIHFTQKKLRYNWIYEKCQVQRYYNLSFYYQFEHEEDQVFFAYSIPYTYSYLLHQISQLSLQNPQNPQIIQISQLNKSLLGLSIPVIKITDPKSSLQQKKIFLCTGRIHSGQSNGSIVLSGLMKYICSKQAQQLRKRTVFIIIPMLNPDGVVLGNYRTGVTGQDLNRLFSNKNKQLYPQIFGLRNLTLKIAKIKQIFMYLDFHGHSEKKNVFVYGPDYTIAQSQYYKARIFPKIISKKTQMFRFYSCTFHINQQKRYTGRGIMFYEFKIPYVYTIQSSNGFYYDSNQKCIFEFNKTKWIEMGSIIGNSLYQHLILIQQYQKFMELRRKMILKRRKHKKNMKSKQNEDESNMRQIQYPLTTQYFFQLIREIQIEQAQQKIDDSQIDSDEQNLNKTSKKIQNIRSKSIKLHFDQKKNLSKKRYDFKIYNKTQISRQKQPRFISSNSLYNQQINLSNKEDDNFKLKLTYQLKNKTQATKQIKNKINYNRKNISISKKQSTIINNFDESNHHQNSTLQNPPEQLLSYNTTVTSLVTQKSKLPIKSTTRNFKGIFQKTSIPNKMIFPSQQLLKTFSVQHNPNQVFSIPLLKQQNRDHIQNSKRVLCCKDRRKGVKSEIKTVQYSKRPLAQKLKAYLMQKQQSRSVIEKNNMKASYRGFSTIFPCSFYKIKQKEVQKKDLQLNSINVQWFNIKKCT